MKSEKNTEATGRTFEVTIVEVLERKVIVKESELKAPTKAEAERQVEDWWNDSQIILGPEDFDHVEFFAREVEEDEA